MKKKLDLLNEEDFFVLRGPFKAGRQSPKNIGQTLLFVPFLLLIFLGLANMFVFVDRIDPPATIVVIICLIYDFIAVLIIIFSFIFSVRKVYQKRQRLQYLISIIVSQVVFGLSLYLISLYILFDHVHFHHNLEMSNTAMAVLSLATFVVGLAVYIFSYFRFIKLLRQGAFRKGSKRDQLRNRLEEKTKKILIYGIVYATILSIYMNSVLKVEIPPLIFMILGTFSLYTMMFILPEQLVTFYCKGRFKSFNLDKHNNLFPLASDKLERENSL